MRIDGTQQVPTASRDAPQPERTSEVFPASNDTDVRTTQRFSVLNDFRYLTDADKGMLAHVTGESIEPGHVESPGSSSAFAQQIALDRRTGALAPNQIVTAVYLKNRAQEIDARNYGRPNLHNPYSGEDMTKALSYLESVGRSRADLRM